MHSHSLTLKYLFTLHPSRSLPPFFPPLPLPSIHSIHFSVITQKGVITQKASHGLQQSTAYQAAIRLAFPPPYRLGKAVQHEVQVRVIHATDLFGLGLAYAVFSLDFFPNRQIQTNSSIHKQPIPFLLYTHHKLYYVLLTLLYFPHQNGSARIHTCIRTHIHILLIL